MGKVRDVAWDGAGPGQRYPDTGQAQRLGRYRATVAELQPGFVRPQEGGSRGGCVRVVIDTPEGALRIDGSGFAFTASPWTTEEIARAERAIDLPSSTVTTIVVDLAQHGIGSASCGPGVLPAYRLLPGPFEAVVSLAGSPVQEPPG
jgi:beta-galactosidase